MIAGAQLCMQVMLDGLLADSGQPVSPASPRVERVSKPSDVKTDYNLDAKHHSAGVDKGRGVAAAVGSALGSAEEAVETAVEKAAGSLLNKFEILIGSVGLGSTFVSYLLTQTAGSDSFKCTAWCCRSTSIFHSRPFGS